MDLHNQPYDHHFSSTHLLNRPVLPTTQFHLPLHSLSPKSLSNNYHSSLDYGEEKYLNRFENQERTFMDERRMRRMVSNRESARRSRMRKRKQIEELQFQVDQLMKLNHQLSEKVISLLENNHQTMQENAELKEKVSSFQMFMADMLLPMRNVEEMNAREMSHILAEASDLLL